MNKLAIYLLTTAAVVTPQVAYAMWGWPGTTSTYESPDSPDSPDTTSTGDFPDSPESPVDETSTGDMPDSPEEPVDETSTGDMPDSPEDPVDTTCTDDCCTGIEDAAQALLDEPEDTTSTGMESPDSPESPVDTTSTDDMMPPGASLDLGQTWELFAASFISNAYAGAGGRSNWECTGGNVIAGSDADHFKCGGISCTSAGTPVKRWPASGTKDGQDMKKSCYPDKEQACEDMVQAFENGRNSN
jgi:hypothetical protein